MGDENVCLFIELHDDFIRLDHYFLLICLNCRIRSIPMVQAYGGRLARVHMVFYDYRNSFFETGIHIEGFNPHKHSNY